MTPVFGIDDRQLDKRPKRIRLIERIRSSAACFSLEQQPPMKRRRGRPRNVDRQQVTVTKKRKRVKSITINDESTKKKSEEQQSDDDGIVGGFPELDSVSRTCPYCDKDFPDARKVAAHVRNIHRKPHKCDLCRRQYYSSKALENHRKTHNTDSHFECSVCHLKYKREETLQSHFVRVHSDMEEKYICDHCGKKYKLKQDLMLHINQVHMCDYQICRYCGKAVKNVKAHEWHHQKKLDAEYNAKLYPCGLCFKKFVSESKLENHLMRHVQRYTCNECGDSFPGPGQLMNHKVKHKPAICCSICGRTFISRSNFYQHVLMHAKVRPYKCDICQDGFTQRSTLIRHRRTHPGPLPDTPGVVPIAELARKVLKNWNYTDIQLITVPSN